MKNNLKVFRKKNKKTQEQVANDLNINRQTYCNYENGVREPDLETLTKLAIYFSTSIDSLLGVSNDTVELNSFPDYKRELIENAIKLSERECEKANAYLMGILGARDESQPLTAEERKIAYKALTDYYNNKNKGGA